MNHQYEVLFILGHKLGELSREIELVVETAQRDEKSERLQIKVIRVYEILKYIHNELIQLEISNEIQKDIEAYMSTLAKNYSEIKDKIDREESQDFENEMIVSKIKRKMRRKNRDLKLETVKEFHEKLKIWKDRITIELSRSSAK
ncbi:MAG: hypothetical protein JSW11_09190 [Candidatus Heimdallarchaeota archaeon]|nr:MAG: hypothetical protein JSW11_09190 [Candidatus Heimdallarchaeota archaeon]